MIARAPHMPNALRSYIECQPADITKAIYTLAAMQSTCWVRIYIVAQYLGLDGVKDRDWLLDELAMLDQSGAVMLGHLNEPQALSEWERTWAVPNALGHACHEVCINPEGPLREFRHQPMNWTVENGTASFKPEMEEILRQKPDFPAIAAASLQVLAARQAGLHLDHQTLMRKAMPDQPQAPRRKLSLSASAAA